MRIRIIVCQLLCIVYSIHGQQLDISSIQNLNIRNVGPANMSGRITAIDAVVADPKIIYVGAASGGAATWATG